MSYFHDNYRKFRTASGILVCSSTKIAFSDSLAEELIRVSSNNATANPSDRQKAGRGSVYHGEFRSGERYVLRHYLRGGLAKHISSESYLNLPLSSLRPLLELEILAGLYSIAIKVPEPLFSIIEYGALGFSYSGAIATAEVKSAVNFLEVARSLTLEENNRISRQAGIEAAKVLKAGIFHRDLHPGNVLLDAKGNIFLIDFDKAFRFERSKIASYIQPLEERWERAVKKRNLGENIAKQFKLGIAEELKSTASST